MAAARSLTHPATLVRVFKVLAVVEAFTWAGLLFGMLTHYVFDTGRLGITVFGPIHGAAFVAFAAITLLVAWRLRWGIWPTLIGLASAVPPFTTIWFERWADRAGLLDARRATAVSEDTTAGARG